MPPAALMHAHPQCIIRERCALCFLRVARLTIVVVCRVASLADGSFDLKRALLFSALLGRT